MRKFVLLVVMGLVSVLTHAQTASTKIGYADLEYIYSEMPDAKRIEAELKSTQSQLKAQIDAKVQEFQKKLADYQANINTMLDAVRVNTERELQQLQQNLEKLQADAQTTIQNKHAQLMDPVNQKIAKAIDEVAKENGFNMILTAQIGGLDVDVVLYADEKSDISDLVLKKMGITPKPATATTTAPK